MKKITILLAVLISASNLLFAQLNVQIINSSDVTCYGSCDGSATAIATGGTPPYTYLWSNMEQTITVIDLCAGVYNLTVTDAAMLTATTAVIINQVPQLVANVENVISDCSSSCSGQIVISVSGGAPAYMYIWSNGSTTLPATNLCGGTWICTVTDVNGCTDVISAFIESDFLLDFTINISDATCLSANGSAEVEIISGTPPYVYDWSHDPGLNNAFADSLTAGQYIVTVSLTDGCYKTDTAIVNNVNAADIELVSQQNVSCNGGNDGSLEILPSGGILPYTVSWSHDNLLDSFIADSLATGNYTVTVTDSAGCMGIATFSVSQSGSLFLSITKTDANCSSQGTATVNGFGGTVPYTYLWSNGEVNQTVWLNDGQYSVTISDSHACQNDGAVEILHSCFSLIRGKVFIDTFNICIPDTGEQPLAGINMVANPGNHFANTNAQGEYTIEVDTGTHIISICNPNYIITCPQNPNTITVTPSQLGDTLDNIDFGVEQGLFDLNLHPGWTVGHPGFVKTYWFLFTYVGDGPIDALVRFYYDPILEYDSCSQGGVHYAGEHIIEWTYNDLMPGSYWQWNTRPKAFFTVPVTVSIYDSLSTYFEMLPITGDLNPQNNVLSIREKVSGSHDPNDKQVQPVGQGEKGAILPEDLLLTYTINFQNNGNDTAFTVVLIDTLCPYLDPATVMTRASSHPCDFELSGQGILKWTFNNILLVDSATNEPGSKGFVVFTVEQLPDNPHMTEILNKAEIFFDFNEAIITNTVVNTVDYYLSKAENMQINEIGLKVYPNPVSGEFFVELQNPTDMSFNSNELTYRLYDIKGSSLREGTLNGTKTRISVMNLEAGVYYIKVSLQNSTANFRLIVTE